MGLFTKILFSAILVSQIAACVPAVVGGAAVGGSVAVDRRTSGIYVEDENIELKAANKIRTNLGETQHVSVTSYNRNVLLTGQVTDADTKALAVSLLKEVENVRNITDEVTVNPKSTLSTRTNDTYITSKIKAKLVGDKRVSTNHVKVVTEDSSVFLMGLVTQEEAAIAVDIARNVAGVTRVVKVFEYIQ